MGSAAFIFLLIYIVLIGIPCISIGWLGVKTINRLGRYPSKTPAIQKSIVVILAIIEVISLTLILTFFKILSV